MNGALITLLAAGFLVLAVPNAVHAHDAALPRAAGVDLTKLPLGDARLSDRPRRGWIWACRASFDGPTPPEGPWINGDTYDLTTKPKVRGAVMWPNRFVMRVEGDKRIFETNDLPSHPTGEFPIARDDPAHQWDRNPNRIAAQNMRIELPLNPVMTEPRCVPGAVGIIMSGVVLFSALDAAGKDAVAHEVQDECQGHPQLSSTYHYHSLTTCIEDKRLPGGHSELVGYALDGFGIFGRFGEGGKPLASADLDECHGHAHAIPWNGETVNMYHYHGTWDFPYTIGCMHGRVNWEYMALLSGGRGDAMYPPDAARGRPPGGPHMWPPGRQPAGMGPPGSQRPDLHAPAAKLGISAETLQQALGPSPPDFDAAAKRLGISVEALRGALGHPPRHRP